MSEENEEAEVSLSEAISEDVLNNENDVELKFEERNVDGNQSIKTDLNDDYDEEDDDDDDDDEDDVQVTIGDIKSATPQAYNSYAPVNLNIGKRGPAFGPGGQVTNAASSGKGKTTGLDIDAVGSYNGGSIYDLNLDALEEKPWRKPGADITDYFNYGFNEDTWKIYCERQKKLRLDLVGGPVTIAAGDATAGNSGVAKTFGGQTPSKVDLPIPVASVNENSKYSGMGMTKKAGPPPGRKPSGTIDVIGGGTPSTPSVLPSRRPPDTKENFIQVIGNRPPGPPGPGMPPGPPPFGLPPFGMPPPGMDFPPGMPPPGMPHPPLLPNGQPIPFPPGVDFGPPRFPPPGMPPGMNDGNNFEGDDVNYGEGEERGGDGGPREREGREGNRDYHHSHHGHHRSSRNYNREYRDEGYRRDHHHYREQYEGSHERSRERESKEYDSSSRRHRDRDRDRDRERDKEREREKDGERERDREYRERETREGSRRRHHEYDEDGHSRSSSSSRHKHSKRSKRDKEEEEESSSKH